MWMVARGWRERERSGVTPHPDDIAAIPEEWDADLDQFDALYQYHTSKPGRDSLPADKLKMFSGGA